MLSTHLCTRIQMPLSTKVEVGNCIFYTATDSPDPFLPTFPILRYGPSLPKFGPPACLAECALIVILQHVGDNKHLLASPYLYFGLLPKISRLNKKLMDAANPLIYHHPLFAGNPELTSYSSLCKFIDLLPSRSGLKINPIVPIPENKMAQVRYLDLTSVNLGFMDALVDEKPDWLSRVFNGLPSLEMLRLHPNSNTGMLDSRSVSNLINSATTTAKETKRFKTFPLRFLAVPGLDIQTKLIVPFISLFPNLEGLDISESYCVTFPALEGFISNLPLLNYLDISWCPSVDGDVVNLLASSEVDQKSRSSSPRIQILTFGNPQLEKYILPPPYSNEWSGKERCNGK